MADEMLGGTYSVPSHLLLQQLPDQGLLFLNYETEEYFGLDDTGTAMYEALVSTGSVVEAVEQLAGVYDVERDRLTADLEKFVGALLERGLLVHEQG